MADLNDSLPFLIVGAVIVFVVVAIVASIWYERKRTQKISEVASEMGLAFYPSGDPVLVSQLAAFHLFSQGRGRSITNMIHGNTGDVDVGIFDYKYTVGSGKNSSTWRQTVIAFESADLDLPHFAVRPENLFHKIGKAFGYQDIDFDTHPKFSSTYLLRGTDETRIRALFRAEVLLYLENKAGVSVEGMGRRLVFYRPGQRSQPESIRSLMEEGFELFGLFRASPATES